MKKEQETFVFWQRFDRYVKVAANRANFRCFQKRRIEKNRIVMQGHDELVCAMMKTGIRDHHSWDALYICMDVRCIRIE